MASMNTTTNTNIPKTLDELTTAITAILPNAIVDETNDGQLIIYTDLMIAYSNFVESIVPFVPYEDDEN